MSAPRRGLCELQPQHAWCGWAAWPCAVMLTMRSSHLPLPLCRRRAAAADHHRVGPHAAPAQRAARQCRLAGGLPPAGARWEAAAPVLAVHFTARVLACSSNSPSEAYALPCHLVQVPACWPARTMEWSCCRRWLTMPSWRASWRPSAPRWPPPPTASCGGIRRPPRPSACHQGTRQRRQRSALRPAGRCSCRCRGRRRRRSSAARLRLWCRLWGWACSLCTWTRLASARRAGPAAAWAASRPAWRPTWRALRRSRRRASRRWQWGRRSRRAPRQAGRCSCLRLTWTWRPATRLRWVGGGYRGWEGVMQTHAAAPVAARYLKPLLSSSLCGAGRGADWARGGAGPAGRDALHLRQAA